MTRNDFNAYIKNSDFKNLFNEMGYDHANGINVHLDFDEVRCDFTAVAQKSGFVVFTSQVNEIPSNAFCKQIDSKLRKRANDYILIFIKSAAAATSVDEADALHHLWCVPVKTVEKRNLVSIEYTSLSQTEFLFSKIESLSFGLEEEVTITDVTTKIQNCFTVNSEKVTKDFYTGFKKQHDNFEKFIKGIPKQNSEDRQWYASVMLNRLMFCYFIQKKGFLDFDTDYLQNKLKWSKEQQGKDKFFKSFYKNFLTHLFAGGLNDPAHDKNAEFKKIFGRIPYLNGGMFDQHEIEKQYADLDIEDKAFEDLFNFFDTYRWHLDTRIESSGKDINPDVLGYIFEQYINDRAKMGAYYTKEDITAYIGKNCIIPYLLEQVKEKCPADFDNSESSGYSSGYVWQSLKQSGLRYIYPAVKKGYSADWKNKIPADIAKGLKENNKDAKKIVGENETLETLELLKNREHWNEQTPVEFSLPTEIWRETIERLERCDAIANKIAAGEIKEINDFITYNLDIISFAQDLIENASSIDFVKAFYNALQNITILDPTCGSGAFLFAALNILEPLYDLCLDAMERLGDTTENEEIKKHFRSNRAYFIYKSIILRNLYGVDIMKEAVEIAKLRLFLKMVAVVEVNAREENLGLDPLPDVDFNIRCGNTLVGCVTKKEAEESLGNLMATTYSKEIDKKLKKVAETAEKFRKTQLIENGELKIDNCNTGEETPIIEIKKAKQELTNDLADLNEKLNRQQYTASTGIILAEKPTEKQMQAYSEWLKKTQPFHWIAEFYNIIENGELRVENEEMPRGFESANAASLKKGGFDVIIGNPPYVSANDINYLERNKEFSCSDLYGYVIKRVISLLKDNGKHGFIVMHNLAFSRNFKDVRNVLLTKVSSCWLSFYSRIPAGLFDGNVRVRNAIYLFSKTGEKKYTTRMHRWFAPQRDNLFSTLEYNQFKFKDVVPMLTNTKLQDFFELHKGNSFETLQNDYGTPLFYKKVAYNWLSVSNLEPPCFDKDNNPIPQSELGETRIKSEYYKFLFLLTCGKFYLCKWLTYGDDFHLTAKDLISFSYPFDEISENDKKKLTVLYDEFVEKLLDTVQFKLNAGKNIGTFNTRKLWNITDKSDRIFYKYITDDVDELSELIENQIAVCVISDKANGGGEDNE